MYLSLFSFYQLFTINHDTLTLTNFDARRQQINMTAGLFLFKNRFFFGYVNDCVDKTQDYVENQEFFKV